MRAWLFGGLLALCAGCGASPTYLFVTIAAGQPVALNDLFLRIALDGGAPRPGHQLLDDGQPPTLPAQVIVQLPDDAREIDVLVNANTADAQALFGSAHAVAVAHRRVDVEVDLPGLAAPAVDGGTGGAPGDACSEAAGCASGFCVAGVCCDTACEGGCETCSAASGASADGHCTILPAATVCRPPAGDCDVAETCDGATGACPADQLRPAGDVCRAAAGVCDLPESCSGTEPACPPDQSNCPAQSYCNGTACVAQHAQGQACTQDKECTTGHCSDGVCCDTACSGDCDACNAGNTVGTCTLLPSSTVCRAAKDVCDAVEACTGASATCPPDALKPAGTICRALDPAKPCDLVERCTGLTTKCPADASAPQQMTSFSTSFGRDGFIIDGTNLSLGYQRVEGACYNDGSTSRGYVSFATATLNDGAAILAASLTGCEEGGPGAKALQLYASSFALPLDTTAWNTTVGTSLGGMPDGAGAHTFAVPTSTVKKTAETQYEMRWPESGCTTFHGRRWSSSQATALTNCADHTPWTLTVTYCVP